MTRRKPDAMLDVLGCLLARPEIRVEISLHPDADIDHVLDKMDAAYRHEQMRWCARRKPSKEGYEVFRNGSKNGIDEARDLSDDTVIKLTKREASNYDEADAWCRTYAGRAAMRKALEAVRR